MKIIHLSDLHLGKKIREFSMLEVQKDILDKITDIIETESPDCVIIAGDIYDKSVPPAQAVTLFDEFLCSLAGKNLHTFIISGNHDSPERIAFGGRIMNAEGIHISPVYDGKVKPVTLTDEYGEVNFYMLPFIRPVSVKRFFEDREISSYTDAVNAAVDAMNPDFSARNIIITHQFVTGAVTSESEEISVGGADNVDISAFDGFDYVALGHIHGPQNIGDKRVRYCGTPLKYSFSEANHVKSVTVAELAEKGSLEIKTIPLEPMHDMREIKGKFEDIYSGEASQDYLRVILTDEEDVPEAMSRLRTVYQNIMKLEYDNKRTRSDLRLADLKVYENRTPLELFAEFYEHQNGQELGEEQTEYIKKLIENIWEGEQ